MLARIINGVSIFPTSFTGCVPMFSSHIRNQVTITCTPKLAERVQNWIKNIRILWILKGEHRKILMTIPMTVIVVGNCDEISELLKSKNARPPTLNYKRIKIQIPGTFVAHSSPSSSFIYWVRRPLPSLIAIPRICFRKQISEKL